MEYFGNSYHTFETNTSKNKNELLGKILHAYGSIPLIKQKASVVIKKMLWVNHNKFCNNDTPFYTLGEDVNLSYNVPQDKVRFYDYFDSLLGSKETRGHNFEGFIAGIYNGDLSEPGSRYDVTINNKTWNIKFVDKPSKAPEIGRYKDLLYENNLFDIVNLYKGLTNIFKTDNDELKNEIFKNIISNDITGGWLIAYKDKKENNIIISIIDLELMKEFLLNGFTTSPKGGLLEYTNLALSSRYRHTTKKLNKQFKIIIPELSLDELKEIYINKDEQNWCKNIFEHFGNKIRPDVIRYIKENHEDIAKKLLNFTD